MIGIGRVDRRAFLLCIGGRSAVIPSRPSRFAVALRASLDRMPPPRQGLGKQIRREVSAGAPFRQQEPRNLEHLHLRGRSFPLIVGNVTTH